MLLFTTICDNKKNSSEFHCITICEGTFMNIITNLKDICYVLLKKCTLLNDTIIVKAYAKTIVAESRLLTAIYNSGHVTDITIMNREANGLYTLRVETSVLTTPRGLRNRIAKQMAKF